VPLIAVAGRVRKKGAKSAILDATIGKVEPQKPSAGPSAPRVRRGSFGSSSYGSGSYGKSSYGGSSFK
jgi:hypothetical protein